MAETARGAAQPVEYAVAVERYLAAADLGEGSRRIYRIALATWAWALVDRPVPVGRDRRRALPPVLPLALLDGPQAAERLRLGLAQRAADADPRTVNRELSILRGAVLWWRAQSWIHGDPVARLRPCALPGSGTSPLYPADLRALFALRVPLREQATWHLLHETGAAIEQVLALDIDDLDLSRRRTRPRPDRQANPQAGRPPLHWGSGSARLLPLLLVGRTGGPLLLTDRRATAGTPAADLCPHSGRGRLSYRRAAELFTAATRPLDPEGRGWTLRRLRAAAPPVVRCADGSW
ncbi:hypothetical protein [Kitasatospora sp. GP82]|uniref:hypothetical protein n=1 Tax=Kitasatospora sp. GP82 TaxID=3035089 RepID=UPI00247349C7|nr:hypothetical protein [Kitasatospora sp. GP82]MDH6123503.1 integrase [Kitasatospora sp. GP82]